jgi:hypothetical protein
VAVALEFPGFSGAGGWVVVFPLSVLELEDRRSVAETEEEGAAAMMGTELACPSPVPGAGFAPFPPVFTGAESVAKELGDWKTL